MASDADLEKLQKTGVKSLFSEGDRVEFHSADDQIKLEAHLDRKKRKRFRPTHVRLGLR